MATLPKVNRNKAGKTVPMTLGCFLPYAVGSRNRNLALLPHTSIARSTKCRINITRPQMEDPMEVFLTKCPMFGQGMISSLRSQDKIRCLHNTIFLPKTIYYVI